MWLTKESCLPFDESIYNVSFLEASDIHSDFDWYYPLHSHNWYELVFCIGGCGTVTIDATTFTLREGMGMVIKPNIFHSFFSKKENTFHYCVLSYFNDPVSSIGQFFEATPVILADISNNLDLIKACFRLTKEVYNNGNCIQTPLFYSTCIQLMHVLQYAILQCPLQLPLVKNTVANEILAYIHTHYRENISLENISIHFSISIPHLSRIFKEAYNISPINYLIDYRFCLAKDFLSKTDLDVKAISERVGFQNVSHFSRLFLKRIGCTPLEYRKINHTQFNKSPSISLDTITSIYGNSPYF